MAKSKKEKRETTMNQEELKRCIMAALKANPTRAFNYKELAEILELKTSGERMEISLLLDEMFENGEISSISAGRYKAPSNSKKYIVGEVDLTAKGSAYIKSDETSDKIFVSFANLKHALDGDTVKVMIYARRDADRLEGEVVEILERKRKNIVGVIDGTENYTFLIPTGKQLPYDIFIPQWNLKDAEGKEAKNGDKVIVEITSWPERQKNPVGKVVKVIGVAGDNDTEMNAIMAEFGLPVEFPPEVEAEAEKITFDIPEREIKNRRDMRSTLTFTIDPADAKDFDDAISFKILDNGRYEVGVHIADVSYYVEPDSLLDKEAYARGTSVYLVDRTIPMLPEKLSNGVCSLRPHEDKLTFSAIFEMDENAKVYNSWLGRTIINSDYRFAYEDAQALLEGGKGKIKEEMNILNSLAQKLREQRFWDGALDFDREEVKFELDEKGKPLKVIFKRSKDANKLIEEMMLLANRTVAEFVGKRPKPKTFVYRVHEKPLPDKLQEFNEFAAKFGYNIKLGGMREMTKSINSIMQKVKNRPEENLIGTLAVKTMAKAIYSTDNSGHFGLAFDHYTHFTSPIRRYPDVMVHRLLARYLAGGRSVVKDKYEGYCKHSSEMEQLAASAERGSIKYKQVEFLFDKIGEIFVGTISSVTQFGFFVELNDNKCEGLVSIASLEDDYYVFDEPNYRIVGRHHQKSYQLGDVVTVKVVNANLFARQIDFELHKEGDIFTGASKETTRVAIIGGKSTKGASSAKGSKSGALKGKKGAKRASQGRKQKRRR